MILDLEELKEKLIGLIGKGDWEFTSIGPIVNIVRNEFDDYDVIINDDKDGESVIPIDSLILHVPYANIWSFKYYAGDFNDNNTAFDEQLLLDARFDENSAKNAITALFNNSSYFSIWDLKIEHTLYKDFKPNLTDFE